MNVPINNEKHKSIDPKQYISNLSLKFSENFKLLRIKCGYSQKRLAHILRVSRSTLCAWECAESMPHFETLNEICHLFNVSCEHILGTESPRDAFKEKLYSKYIMLGNKTKYLNISDLNAKNQEILLNCFEDLILEQQEN